jgi:hypothetical protein
LDPKANRISSPEKKSLLPWFRVSNRISPSTGKGDFEGRAPLSSGVLAGGGDERGARLLGGRACIAVGFRSSSFFIPPMSSLSPARVRVPVQFSGDDG